MHAVFNRLLRTIAGILGLSLFEPRKSNIRIKNNFIFLNQPEFHLNTTIAVSLVIESHRIANINNRPIQV